MDFLVKAFCLCFFISFNIYGSEQELRASLERVRDELKTELNLDRLVDLHEKSYKLHVSLGEKNQEAAQHMFQAALLLKKKIGPKETELWENHQELEKTREELDSLLTQREDNPDTFDRAALNKTNKKYRSLDLYYSTICVPQEIKLDSLKKKSASFLCHGADCQLLEENFASYAVYRKKLLSFMKVLLITKQQLNFILKLVKF